MRAAIGRIPVFLFLIAIALVAGSAAGLARQATAAPDVLVQLLQEVRALRTAMEQVASSGPRVQLALGRLQLQEQRVNVALRRAENIREQLGLAQREYEEHDTRLKQLEERSRTSLPEDALSQVRGEAAEIKRIVARLAADVQRLQLEESTLNAEIATEQARWTEINRTIEELERGLVRR